MKKFILLFSILLSLCAFSKARFYTGSNQSLKIADPSFITACSAGLVDGCKVIRKFGIVSDLTSGVQRDIWDFGDTGAPGANINMTYAPDGTAPINTVSGSNVNDDSTILVYGLTADGTDHVQSVTMAGQALVPLTTPLWRVYRLINTRPTTTADRSVGFFGDVYVYVGGATINGIPSDLTSVRAFASNGNNQTQMTQFTIPKGFVGFVLGGAAKMARKQSSSIIYRSWFRNYGGVFRLSDTSALVSLGTGSFAAPSFFPAMLPELMDIVISAEADTNGVGIAASYSILLLEKTKFGIQ